MVVSAGKDDRGAGPMKKTRIVLLVLMVISVSNGGD
jgi:hypothetical protein